MAARDASFASFNLFNLQLPRKEVYSDSDRWEQAIYDRKFAWSAQMSRRLAAGFVGFEWKPSPHAPGC